MTNTDKWYYAYTIEGDTITAARKNDNSRQLPIIGSDNHSMTVFRDLKTTINNEKHIEISLCISTVFGF